MIITANGKALDICGKCGKIVTLNKTFFGGLHLCEPDPPEWVTTELPYVITTYLGHYTLWEASGGDVRPIKRYDSRKRAERKMRRLLKKRATR